MSPISHHPISRHLLTCGLVAALAVPRLAAQGSSAPAPVQELQPVSVTATRERSPLSETPISIGVLGSGAVREAAALHPSQLLGQVPGVAVAVTTGEGHTTAIRQPFTTSPVYLFLEDGIPIRATGFFNHNALYEVNLAQAGGVEVVRGPGTALHGSDAIGGIVNVLSRAPEAAPQGELTAESGAFGTWRLLAGATSALADQTAGRLDLHALHTDGWRRATAYDRRSGNARVDHRLGTDGVLRFSAGFARISQQTGANSSLPFADYVADPTRNNQSIAFRRVEATRVSGELERGAAEGRLSLIGFFRDNAMDLNGTYNLNSDPRIERSHNVSLGLLAKWRRSFAPGRTRLIIGADLDRSPGSRQEDNLIVTRSGTGAGTVFSAYTLGTRIYDYGVTFSSLSPYTQVEFSPAPRWRVTAGLRRDALGYRFSNHLPAGTVAASVLGATRHYGQLADSTRSFTRLSPKLGVTYDLGGGVDLHASHHYGFRAPSEAQLFRAGNDTTPAAALSRARLALGLQPIRAAQTEAGLRAHTRGWSVELTAYSLVKRDDLLSQRDLATNVTTSVNAGRTEHRGLELGLGAPLAPRLRLDTALAVTRQRYVDWLTASANFSGKEIEAAPRVTANTRLSFRPASGSLVQLEWVRIGAYWLEAGNSPAFGRYPGHDLLNFRLRHAVTRRVALSARVLNLADRRFAESASVTSNTAVFSPGLPRAAYGGLELTW